MKIELKRGDRGRIVIGNGRWLSYILMGCSSGFESLFLVGVFVMFSMLLMLLMILFVRLNALSPIFS